jgi:hypothetical protein
MQRVVSLAIFMPLALGVALGQPAAKPRIAVIGLVHSHVWGHLGKMVQGEPATLVGIAESVPELVAEAQKRGATAVLFF